MCNDWNELFRYFSIIWVYILLYFVFTKVLFIVSLSYVQYTTENNLSRVLIDDLSLSSYDIILINLSWILVSLLFTFFCNSGPAPSNHDKKRVKDRKKLFKRPLAEKTYEIWKCTKFVSSDGIKLWVEFARGIPIRAYHVWNWQISVVIKLKRLSTISRKKIFVINTHYRLKLFTYAHVYARARTHAQR